MCSFNDRPRFAGRGQQVLDLEQPEVSIWAPALSLRPTADGVERDRLFYITAVGDRWAHVLWGARALVGRERMDEMIFETWNELNVGHASRLGHAEFRAGLMGRLAHHNPDAAAALDRRAKDLLSNT